jgi:tRNA threonylcarbamoyl adenosine modification protein YjeE
MAHTPHSCDLYACTDEPQRKWVAKTPEATRAFAEFLATALPWEKGDQMTLSGPLGSGKSLFARAFIRAFLKDPALTVPSPTFTLIQVYSQSPPALFGHRPSAIVHSDFYRLQDYQDLLSLAWEDAIQDSLALIEWPTHVPDALEQNRIDLTLSSVPECPESRILTFTAHGNKKEYLDIITSAYHLVETWAPQTNSLHFEALDGDASSRRYVRVSHAEPFTERSLSSQHRHDDSPSQIERSQAGSQIRQDGLLETSALIMFSPPVPPTPYSLQTHLAHDIRPFVAVSYGLRDKGLSAPQIYGVDEKNGILLIEDLGSAFLITPDASPIKSLERSVEVLAFLHDSSCTDSITYPDHPPYVLPPYDRSALQTELGVFLEWYLKHQPQTLSLDDQKAFFSAWDPFLEDIVRGPRTWTLRDYHSPNLLDLENRHGRERVGIIDFQDALWGHPAYDLASLLQDARITIHEKDEETAYAFYIYLRREHDPQFDSERFLRAYKILAVQRATKVLGVFSRLVHRDGKSRYGAHIPRVERYLARTLAGTLFETLRPWYAKHLSHVFKSEF